MGLDINPLAKPLPGHEEEFERVWTSINIETGNLPNPELAGKGFWGRLFTKTTPIDVKAFSERFTEISVPAYAAIGAPVVGTDAEADAWVRKSFEDGDMTQFGSAEEALGALKGYHAIEAMPDCEGFPVYTNAYMYEGVDRTSFRGKFLEDCRDCIGEDLLAQAWNPMLADEFGAYGRKLRAAADVYAASNGVEHVLGQKTLTFDDPDGPAPEVQAHIVDQAARWCLFWAEKGHGSEPFF